MTLTEFKAQISARPLPPPELSAPLRALWLCRAGRWQEAHAVAQEIDTSLGSWIHGLLHEIEGDQSNAGYWYARAGRRNDPRHGIDEEWERIALAVLAET